MSKLAALLFAILGVAFVAASCTTSVFWAATAPSSAASAPTSVNSQSSHLTKMSAAGQTNQSLETTPSISTTSGLHVLALQSAARSNATPASNILTANNTTRIMVPISTAKNVSNAGAQTNNRFAFPTWLWTWALILILVIILIYLLLRLVHESNGEPPERNTRRVATTQSPSETSKARPRQIPIEGALTGSRLTDDLSSHVKDQKVRIPIETPEEQRETEEKSQ